MKKTKQGVRDLNTLPSKPKGKVLAECPAEAMECKHPHTREGFNGIYSSCDSCGAMWDWNGKAFLVERKHVHG